MHNCILTLLSSREKETHSKIWIAEQWQNKKKIDESYEWENETQKKWKSGSKRSELSSPKWMPTDESETIVHIQQGRSNIHYTNILIGIVTQFTISLPLIFLSCCVIVHFLFAIIFSLSICNRIFRLCIFTRCLASPFSPLTLQLCCFLCLASMLVILHMHAPVYCMCVPSPLSFLCQSVHWWNRYKQYNLDIRTQNLK